MSNIPRFPFNGQRSIYRLKSDNDFHEHQVTFNSSKQPYIKQFRDIYSNIQEPLHNGTVQRRQRFTSSIMGQTLTAGKN